MLLFSMIILFAACQKNYELNTPVKESMPEESIDMIQILSQKAVIGEQLPNPYSLENMKAAYAALDPETKSSINESSGKKFCKGLFKYFSFFDNCIIRQAEGDIIAEGDGLHEHDHIVVSVFPRAGYIQRNIQFCISFFIYHHNMCILTQGMASIKTGASD